MPDRVSPPDSRPDGSKLVRLTAGQSCCEQRWEAAYRRFETSGQEIAKFKRRLRSLGAADWRSDAEIVELFCGRGNGIRALEQLGFTHVEGVDLSADLISEYQGPATCYVADCRELPFDDGSRDVLIVQGGLHHLLDLPQDLCTVLDEVRRVLRRGGRLVAVEPWRTPFLELVHAASGSFLRRFSAKLDAFATMVECEQETYFRWLGIPDKILSLLNERFHSRICRVGWGKLAFVGELEV